MTITCIHCGTKKEVCDPDAYYGVSPDFTLINEITQLGLCRHCFSIPGTASQFYAEVMVAKERAHGG